MSTGSNAFKMRVGVAKYVTAITIPGGPVTSFDHPGLEGSVTPNRRSRQQSAPDDTTLKMGDLDAPTRSAIFRLTRRASRSGKANVPPKPTFEKPPKEGDIEPTPP
jgi:hypothetical protein